MGPILGGVVAASMCLCCCFGVAKRRDECVRRRQADGSYKWVGRRTGEDCVRVRRWDGQYEWRCPERRVGSAQRHKPKEERKERRRRRRVHGD